MPRPPRLSEIPGRAAERYRRIKTIGKPETVSSGLRKNGRFGSLAATLPLSVFAKIPRPVMGSVVPVRKER